MNRKLSIAISLVSILCFTVIFSSGARERFRGKNAGGKGDTVILLHGLGRTSLSMSHLEKELSRKGYVVCNIDYPSTRFTIENLSEYYLKPAIEKASLRDKPVHFVTHSMGGIVVRQYLNENSIANLGRTVMLSPPNRGSELAESFKGQQLYKIALGPAGQQLGMTQESLPVQLQRASFEVGIITGDHSLTPLLSSFIEGPDDGKVAVVNTRLEGMKDFLIVPSSHTFIMNNPFVIDQIDSFLKKGKFDHKKKTPGPVQSQSWRDSEEFKDILKYFAG